MGEKWFQRLFDSKFGGWTRGKCWHAYFTHQRHGAASSSFCCQKQNILKPTKWYNTWIQQNQENWSSTELIFWGGFLFQPSSALFAISLFLFVQSACALFLPIFQNSWWKWKRLIQKVLNSICCDALNASVKALLQDFVCVVAIMFGPETTTVVTRHNALCENAMVKKSPKAIAKCYFSN